MVREVELVPRRGWGGEGALGAVLGFGALHRLPVGLGEEMQAPGENLFDADNRSMEPSEKAEFANTFQPAPVENLPPPPMISPNLPPPPMLNPNAPAATTSVPSRQRKGKNHGAALNSGFDDIFAEGAKKSAEQDHIPSRKGTPIAPPPRLGSAGPTPLAMASDKDDPPGEDLGEPGDAEET